VDPLNSEPPPNQTKACTDTPTTARAFLTVPELAELLRISRNAAYLAIERGEVPGVVRIGRTIRIRRSAVVQ
jgi:excisionase family DNA binding protein